MLRSLPRLGPSVATDSSCGSFSRDCRLAPKSCRFNQADLAPYGRTSRGSRRISRLEGLFLGRPGDALDATTFIGTKRQGHRQGLVTACLSGSIRPRAVHSSAKAIEQTATGTEWKDCPADEPS